MQFKDKFFSNTLGYFHQDLVRYILGLFILYRIGRNLISNPTIPNIVLGIVLLIMGLVFFFAKKGIEIDFNTKKYRYLYIVFGVKASLGWKPLPEVEYISVLKEIKAQEIELNLIYSKTKKIQVAELKDKEQAFYAAQFFAHNMAGIRVLDATVRPFAWVNE